MAEKEEHPQTWKDFVAGTVGGCAGVLAGHPMDTVKVRLQSTNKYSGTWNCLLTIVREERLRGLYKGMTSPLLGVAAINSLLFGVYGFFLNIQLAASPDSLPTINQVFFAGCGSGFVNAFFSCPMELIKIRLQNQIGLKSKSDAYRGPLAAIRSIYRIQGLRGFYQGFTATLIRETPSYGLYFASFEVFSQWLNVDPQSSSPSTGILVAGGAAGMMGWLSTYPFDVIKTKLQSVQQDSEKPFSRTLDCIRKAYRTEGPGVFVRGLGATMWRAAPTNAATFYVRLPYSHAREWG